MNIIPKILLSLVLCLPLVVSATDIRVQVYDRANQAPLAGVAVCVGTSARLDQFGAHLTDRRGYVLFPNVPYAPVVVTVSRTGYKSEQENIVNSGSDRVLTMSLSTGGGGTPCPLGSDSSDGDDGGPIVSSFLINGGKADTSNYSIRLDSQVEGRVTQYRASERADFSDASWQNYNAAAAFQLSAGAGRKTVYFQARRHADINGAVLESVSAVARDSITLQ